MVEAGNGNNKVSIAVLNQQYKTILAELAEIKPICEIVTRHDEKIKTIRQHISGLWAVCGLIAGAILAFLFRR